MKVIVRTQLTQELIVPDGWTREDVFNFLAEHQSFRSAFEGVGNDQARIYDVYVIDEVVEQLGEECFDE